MGKRKLCADDLKKALEEGVSEENRFSAKRRRVDKDEVGGGRGSKS